MPSLSIFRLAAVGFFLILSGCASLPDNTGKQNSSALTNPQETTIGRKFEALAAAHPAGQSGFHLVPNGYEAFVARAALAQTAEHTIDSQYYMVHEDMVGILYMDQLIKAADRGVRVRFLLDDIDEGERDFKLALFDYHPNIEVRIFNPFGRNVGKTVQYLTGFGKQTRRAHNKSFTVDNIATVLGGRNIGDEYFEADANMGFADMDVVSVGPVAQEVSVSFDQYWNHSLSYPIGLLNDIPPTEQDYREARARLDKYVADQADSEYVRRLASSNLAREIRKHNVQYAWAKGHVYADPPEKLMVKTGDTTYQMFTHLWPYIEAANSQLNIASPYFVPGRAGTKKLVALQQKGVKVRVLTNSLSSTDVSIVHAGYARYRKALLRGGIELYELNRTTSREDRRALRKGKIGASKTSLHAKEFIVDRDIVFIGSLNLDQRSVVQNTEIGVVIESEELANTLVDRFEERKDVVAFRLRLEKDDEGMEHIIWTGLVEDEMQEFTKDPLTSFWQRFVVGFLRIMPIESQI